MPTGMWRCWPALALLGLLAVVCSSVRSAPGETPPTDDAVPVATSHDPAEPIPAEIVSDLLKLRQLPSLGLFSKENAFEPLATEIVDLPYSADEAASDGDRELFASELERLSRTSQGEIEVPCDVQTSWPASGDCGKQKMPALPLSAKEALRAAAFELDKAAHHLECHELFERGDQLRQLAQQLRKDAREPSEVISFNCGMLR